MNLFARPEYESDFTLWLNAWKQRDPDISEGQRAGLALLWNKQPIDPDERRRARASAVKRPSYSYA